MCSTFKPLLVLLQPFFADGSIVTRGDADDGGDSSAVQDLLRNAQHIQRSRSAFAIILDDGSVVSWGNARDGGDSSAVQATLV